MNSDTKNALIVVAVGAVGAYAYLQLRKARAAAPQANAGGGACAQLGKVEPLAGMACALAGAIADAVPEANPDTKNVQLNGPIVERRAMTASPEFWASGQGHIAVGGRTWGVLRGREVPRHRNGCVPIFGTSDKCATGTVGYARSGRAFSGEPLTSATAGADGPKFDGDPLTQRSNGNSFPLQCSGQEKWWVAGQPKCCPPGWSPVRRQNGDGTWSVDCQTVNVIKPVGLGAFITPVSPKGTKPGATTQGGAVVTVANTPRNAPVLPSKQEQQQAAIAALRGGRPRI